MLICSGESKKVVPHRGARGPFLSEGPEASSSGSGRFHQAFVLALLTTSAVGVVCSFAVSVCEWSHPTSRLRALRSARIRDRAARHLCLLLLLTLACMLSWYGVLRRLLLRRMARMDPCMDRPSRHPSVASSPHISLNPPPGSPSAPDSSPTTRALFFLFQRLSVVLYE